MGSNNKNIISLWLGWHFVEMPEFLFSVWKNYLGFAINYFSAPLLLKTFFSPWRRYNWMYPKGLNVVEFFNTLISNFFSRILGAIIRFFLIIFGILFQIFIFFAGLAVILLWIFMPLLIIAGLYICL